MQRSKRILSKGVFAQPHQSVDSPAKISRLTGTGIVGDFSQVLIGTRMNGMRFKSLDFGTGTNADGDTLNAVTQVGR